LPFLSLVELPKKFLVSFLDFHSFNNCLLAFGAASIMQRNNASTGTTPLFPFIFHKWQKALPSYKFGILNQTGFIPRSIAFIEFFYVLARKVNAFITINQSLCDSAIFYFTIFAALGFIRIIS